MATGTIRNNQFYPYRSASQEAGFFCVFFSSFMNLLCTFAPKLQNTTMNRLQLTAVVLTALLATSCGKKKETNDIIVHTVETPKPQGPVRMQPYDQTNDVQWLGKEYQVAINRVSCDSLPMVKDETGQQFIDNRITVRILRSDGSVFFKRVFTKADFVAQLDDDYRKTGILEGIVYDKTDGNNIIFAGSVSHPQTDEYIPLVVSVTNFGEVSIRRDDQMDTSGSLPAEEPNSDDEGV